jgi:hypothetical protein
VVQNKKNQGVQNAKNIKIFVKILKFHGVQHPLTYTAPPLPDIIEEMEDLQWIRFLLNLACLRATQIALNEKMKADRTTILH